MSTANPSFNSVALLKQQARLKLQQVRQQISKKRRQQASKEACQTLIKICEGTFPLLSFASFGSEIDLWPFNAHLLDTQRLILPRVQEQELHLFQINALDQLEQNPWGFYEPKLSCSRLDPSLLKIALIPGLGFDPQTNQRLGYGKGYYDRLLQTFKGAQTWGIGFKEQEVLGLPFTAHDVPLTYLYFF